MTHNTYKSFQTKETPQSQPIPGSDQVQNNAGGFAFAIDDWARLDRFLVLGSEGGTYYVKEQKLTQRNANTVMRCIKADGRRVVNRVVEISEAGRAARNTPALFVLAMCAGMGDYKTRKLALGNLNRVARTGTHLFQFLDYVDGFRGWGRGLKRAVGNWYESKDPDRLAYQLIKYRQRHGWTHRDALRLAHPVPQDNLHKNLYRWVTQGEILEDMPSLVFSFSVVQNPDIALSTVVGLIEEENLPREAIPTHLLNEVAVWDALLQRMPITATIRNLGKMTSIGLLKPMSKATQIVVDRLATKGPLLKARVHPLSILFAMKTYRSGHGFRGSLKWQPVGAIVDALDKAFYMTFDSVEPTNKRTMLALDISGSMTWSSSVIMNSNVTAREASAAMAMVTARREPNYMVTAFSDGIVNVPITPRQRLDDVTRTVSKMRAGGTDCALPMLHAIQQGLEIDTFVIYTDSETWAGRIHPVQALQQYRQKTGIPAKLITVGMTSSGFSIADPEDGGMLDVVGFDTATPNLISAFSVGL